MTKKNFVHFVVNVTNGVTEPLAVLMIEMENGVFRPFELIMETCVNTVGGRALFTLRGENGVVVEAEGGVAEVNNTTVMAAFTEVPFEGVEVEMFF